MTSVAIAIVKATQKMLIKGTQLLHKMSTLYLRQLDTPSTVYLKPTPFDLPQAASTFKKYISYWCRFMLSLKKPIDTNEMPLAVDVTTQRVTRGFLSLSLTVR